MSERCAASTERAGAARLLRKHAERTSYADKRRPATMRPHVMQQLCEYDHVVAMDGGTLRERGEQAVAGELLLTPPRGERELI